MREPIIQVICVGVGGGVGSIARYGLVSWALQFATPGRFPLGTFLVNAIGCLVIGVLAGLSAKYDVFSETLRLLLFTGLLGGFTTFSAFGLETVSLLRRGEPTIAALYVGASLVIGLCSVWGGMKFIELVSS